MTTTQNQHKKSPVALSTRFATRGYQIGAVLGILSAFVYGVSSANPDRGHWLSLSTLLIIFVAIIVTNLLGGAIGYGIGKLFETKQTKQS